VSFEWGAKMSFVFKKKVIVILKYRA